MHEANYVVMTVPNQGTRDKTIKDLYQKLLVDGASDLIVENDRVDRIRVYHTVGNGVRVLVRTYIAVIISTNINLKALEGFSGKVTFRLESTIEELKKVIVNLSKLNGKQVIKADDSKNFEQILRSLSEK